MESNTVRALAICTSSPSPAASKTASSVPESSSTGVAEPNTSSSHDTTATNWPISEAILVLNAAAAAAAAAEGLQLLSIADASILKLAATPAICTALQETRAGASKLVDVDLLVRVGASVEQLGTTGTGAGALGLASTTTKVQALQRAAKTTAATASTTASSASAEVLETAASSATAETSATSTTPAKSTTSSAKSTTSSAETASVLPVLLVGSTELIGLSTAVLNEVAASADATTAAIRLHKAGAVAQLIRVLRILQTR